MTPSATSNAEKTNAKAQQETYNYDELNRLKSQQLNDQAQHTYAYNTIGNLTQKDTITDYQYGQDSDGSQPGPGPHAVIQAQGKTYSYDGNGNIQTISDGTNIDWSPFNKPILISKANQNSARFQYGPDRNRILQVRIQGTEETQTHYLGTYQRIQRPDGSIEHKQHIPLGGATLIHTQTTDGEAHHYLLPDHLGSTDVIVDAQGTPIDNGRQSFDAWGKTPP